MKATKGTQSRKKTPSDWLMVEHSSLIQAYRYGDSIAWEGRKHGEALAAARNIRNLLKSLKEFPLHPTARILAESPKEFATRIREEVRGVFVVRVTAREPLEDIFKNI